MKFNLKIKMAEMLEYQYCHDCHVLDGTFWLTWMIDQAYYQVLILKPIDTWKKLNQNEYKTNSQPQHPLYLVWNYTLAHLNTTSQFINAIL